MGYRENHVTSSIRVRFRARVRVKVRVRDIVTVGVSVKFRVALSGLPAATSICVSYVPTCTDLCCARHPPVLFLRVKVRIRVRVDKWLRDSSRVLGSGLAVLNLY